MEKSLEVHEYVKHRIIMWSSISPPRHRPQILENSCSNKNVYISVHSSWKTETAQIAINRWADKQKAVYNGIFISHKKGWDSDRCYNMDDPWIYDTQWKKWDIKRLYIVWFHWYEISWIGKSIEIESRLVMSKCNTINNYSLKKAGSHGRYSSLQWSHFG